MKTPGIPTEASDPAGAAATPPAPDGTPGDRGKDQRTGRLAEFAEAYMLAALTLILLVFFAVLPSSGDTFFTAANLRIVAADQAFLLVVSIAVLVPIVANTWDFTPGANAGMCAIFAAATVSSTGSIPLAILASLGVGIATGAVNGLMITRLRINSVIATLGMTIVIEGIVQWKTGGSAIIQGIPRGLIRFGSNSFLGVPYLAWVAIIVALVSSFVLSRTVYGRRLYAVGSNSSAARLVGLRNERLVFSTYLISGALAAIGGILLLARTGGGNPQQGPDYILPAYAAVFLGSSAVSPGRWNVWGVAIAVLFLGILNSGLTLAGANSYVNSLVNGIALIVGVGIANVLAKRRGRTLEMQ